LLKKSRKIKNFNVRQRRKKRAEAICTRLSCLKFLQSKECKAGNKDMEKQGKTCFWGRNNSEKKALNEKKEIKLKQIYLKKEKIQRNIMR
jgi:hypothetical protein